MFALLQLQKIFAWLLFTVIFSTHACRRSEPVECPKPNDAQECLPLHKERSNVIDLTYDISDKTFVHPAHQGGFTLTPIVHEDLGIYVAMNRIESAEHVGTHIDAPAHFVQYAKTIEKMSLQHMIGRGVMIDLVKDDGRHPTGDYDISVQDLLDWEDKNGKISDDVSTIFFRTGFGQYFETNITKYLGTDDITNMYDYHFPGIGADLANYLVDNYNIRVVGTDTISTDSGNSETLAAHQTLLANKIFLLENLANLHLLTNHQAKFHAIVLPMKIKGGTGSPTRVLALLDED